MKTFWQRYRGIKWSKKNDRDLVAFLNSGAFHTIGLKRTLYIWGFCIKTHSVHEIGSIKPNRIFKIENDYDYLIESYIKHENSKILEEWNGNYET